MRLQERRVLALALPVTILLLPACAAPTVADGARQIYSVSAICPAEAVTIRARPDLAPHSVLKDVTPPPGVNLDSVGDTYEMSGCDKKLLMVCAHPVEGAHPDPFSAGVKQGEYGTELSLNTEYFTLVRALSVDGGRVSSVVVCQPGGAAPQ